ncbi:Putative DNA-binding protein [Salinisphaera shabanensis E1L3A]|uniref:DNA-binding protein n=1 Tax=Salinisphaera shabanensis E1L3A TaxID=1033802 RepID=U2E0T6_9GAMM|nr:ImmA/IrrE family metallo-endopeptidase [Salinisphaera shabanensis]ERJ17531.1 Putative DNA-binding protein [Salinisphaera shabanensis E1L3A]
MAEGLRRMIGQAPGLQFELSRKCASDSEAWGYGRAFLDNETVWSAESDAPLKWAWIDLLEFLGRNWPWLCLEQQYPINLNPVRLVDLHDEAERRWADMSDERVEAEDEQLCRFVGRHDLAAAFKGMFVESLMVLRQGAQYEIYSARLERSLWLPKAAVQEALVEVGNTLAEWLGDTSDARADAALAQWRDRETRLRERQVAILSGLSVATLRDLEGDQPSAAFWELPAGDASQSDTELLAAARMSGPALGNADRGYLLEMVRNAPHRTVSTLDDVCTALRDSLALVGPPHEQGYAAANWLRTRLGVDTASGMNVEAWLDDWNIDVREIKRDQMPLDAVAAWGPHHGPMILLNVAQRARPSKPAGRASTLAHEMAHLLLDRDGALPMAEALGGATPAYVEKRANAFAAELLLPRSAAAGWLRKGEGVGRVLRQLRTRFKVSEELAGWQIYNSSAFDTLDADEQALILRKTRFRGDRA